MRATLTAQVQSVLAYVAETGARALTRMRAAGADTFDIRSFSKLDCTSNANKPGHVCGFALRVESSPASCRRRCAGASTPALVFVNEDRAETEETRGYE